MNVLAVLWVGCGVVNYFITRDRDIGNPLGWAVVGVLFGPFGLLLAAVLAARPLR